MMSRSLPRPTYLYTPSPFITSPPSAGIERLAAVTGGEIASTFDKPELVSLGECKLIDEFMVGEDRLIRFSGCKANGACTIVLRGASSHLLGNDQLIT